MGRRWFMDRGPAPLPPDVKAAAAKAVRALLPGGAAMYVDRAGERVGVAGTWDWCPRCSRPPLIEQRERQVFASDPSSRYFGKLVLRSAWASCARQPQPCPGRTRLGAYALLTFLARLHRTARPITGCGSLLPPTRQRR